LEALEKKSGDEIEGYALVRRDNGDDRFKVATMFTESSRLFGHQMLEEIPYYTQSDFEIEPVLITVTPRNGGTNG